MTCFWDGIRSKLNISTDNVTLIRELKNKNQKIKEIYWNSNTEPLTDKQAEENYEHINSFNEHAINDGYDCSCCDPFLILISYLYNINIEHNYNGVVINYINHNHSNKINFYSDRGHFW